MKTNEKGMTLIEVLVTIVITSIFMGIIYGVVIMAMNYNTVETTKTKLQQEANYIVTEIQRIHRHNDYYEFILLEDKIVIIECEASEENCSEEYKRIISNGYIYEAEIVDCPDNDCLVNSKKSDLIFNEIKISDPKNDNLSVKISTVISRYKDSD